MSVVIVTGSAGLIGSEAVRYFEAKGFDVIGIDNDMRSYFFGETASVQWNVDTLKAELDNYSHHAIDIRNNDEITKLFKKYGNNVYAIVHAAAQPSHDWAASEPQTDFSINANGTLNLLESYKNFCPDASFVYLSTNKVYGDTPNGLPLLELDTRWEIDHSHEYFKDGIDESMSVDQTKHSLFGASKLAADILVQEYGRYFELNTVCFRGGCLTGPSHSGAQLHGFLAYLVRCALTNTEYTIFGYKGKQVRDNIHSFDLVSAIDTYCMSPKSAVVYNMGGSRFSNCSVIEAISIIENITSKKMSYSISEDNRVGDHIWWISDVGSFKRDYPEWRYEHSLESMLQEMIASQIERLV